MCAVISEPKTQFKTENFVVNLAYTSWLASLYTDHFRYPRYDKKPVYSVRHLKLHATKWPNLFQENKTWEKCTKIKKKKNEDLSNNLHVMCD
jgi:hypothetical protein